ncbi:MAG: co-chaperone GroES [Candidatus Portnoybacteria bacterium]|nr:co-chaperone GroES [Candidatus Portnoybacteria bacterium]
MEIKPLADRVLIEPISTEEKTKSGIILPDTADKEKPEQGRVVATGPGRPNKPISVKKGDVVLFTKYGPNEIKINNKEYLIAKEEDILAILE